MKFKINLSIRAERHLENLKNDPSKTRILKDVSKALDFMEINLRHPSLNTHPFDYILGPNNEKVFEAYAQQNTPCAYRIFWYYGPKKNEITIMAILPHPTKKIKSLPD